jgi:uncharacterized protein YlxW (UPF0749 family)
MQTESRRRTRGWVIAVFAGIIAYVGVIQVRSQVEVVRSLEGQDNTSLAFLIDDLHRANDALATETATLATRRDSLKQGSQPAGSVLTDEAQRLRIVEGTIAVHGPGVVIAVDAPLQQFDLQDAINNLHAGGAEAISINDRRVITGSVIRQSGSNLTIDGTAVRGPWTFVAIGDPVRLSTTADLMTRSMRTDPKVKDVSYRSVNEVAIRAVISQRPNVYGTS